MLKYVVLCVMVLNVSDVMCSSQLAGFVDSLFASEQDNDVACTVLLSLHSRNQFPLLVLVGTRQSVVELALERTRKEKYLGFVNLCWRYYIGCIVVPSVLFVFLHC